MWGIGGFVLGVVEEVKGHMLEQGLEHTWL